MKPPHRFSDRLAAGVASHWHLAAIGLVALVAAWPLLAEPGLLNTRGGGDSPFLLQRLQQLETALRHGHFPVRWMPDANYGFGYPFFNFYAPLSMYITAVFRLPGFSIVRAIQLSQLAGFLVAAWAMFRLGRRWWGNAGAGLLAAVAYTVAPFHLVNVYVRGDSLAEFWAMAFYPLVILAADKLHRARDRRAQAGLALAYAGLILTHNISALIFSPFLLLFLLLRGRGPGDGGSPAPGPHRPIPRGWLLALGLALGLAAWFFVPALGEQSVASLEPITAGYFHYSNHFRGTDLVQSSLLFDFNPDGGRAFRMGLVQTVTALLGVVVLVWYRRRRPGGVAGDTLAFVLITLVVATFMITPLSRPLWDRLPLLPFTQFPWRFLSVQAMATALAAGGLALLPGRAAVATTAVALLLVGGTAGLQPDYLRLTDADVTPIRLAQYEWFTGNIGTTVSAEYLPPTVTPRPVTSPWLEAGARHRVQVADGALIDATLLTVRTARQQWSVTGGDQGATLIFPTLYWPGWTARVDGAAVPIRPAAGTGLITVAVPPGRHAVALQLTRTPLRLGAELLSLAALAATLWLLRPTRPRRALRAGWRPALAGLLSLAAIGAAVRLWPQPALPASDLTWDFAQMGYLHHDTAGVPFDNGLLLAGYRFAAETATAGEAWSVTLDLTSVTPVTAVTGVTATLALATPAVHRFPDAPVVAAATFQIGPRPLTVTLPLPANAPSGLAVPRLTVAGARPLLPSGASRGPLFLRPVHIRPAPAALLPPPAEPAGLAVVPVAVQPDPGAVQLQLAWRTAAPQLQNHAVSLRLLDVTGRRLAQFDGQPGYGFQPSSGWPAATWVNDWLALPLSASATGTPPYRLTALLYDPGGAVRLQRLLGELAPTEGGVSYRPHQPVFALPDGLAPAAVTFLDAGQRRLALVGYRVSPAGNSLTLTLAWRAATPMTVDYTRFVHLLDGEGVPVVQVDSMPLGDSYPTSQWADQEVIVDPVTLNLADVPPGAYRLAAGFYHNLGDRFPRLAAEGVTGQRLPGDAFLLPSPIIVAAP